VRRWIPLLRDLPVEVSVLASIAFFVALGFGIVIPSIPIFADSFGVSALAASAVVSAFALMRFVSSPFAGAWTNRFGERRVLAAGLGIVAVSSLGTDALSANPIGVSLIPCFLPGVVLNLQRHLLLREQRFAQVWLGLSAGIAMPLLTWGLLQMEAQPQPMGFSLLFRIVLLGILNAAACPALFVVFDGLRDAFEYKPIAEMGFRSDREIKRGRT